MKPTETVGSPRRSRGRHLLGVARRRADVLALSLVLAGCAVVALETGATADSERLEGQPVPDADVPAVVEASLSCPTLTAPRVAAQIMGISGFGATKDGNAAKPGVVGVAGLDDPAWRKWQPWPEAARSDRRANIVALGHRTCDYVGQLRAAGITQDLWRVAVAAERLGLRAVIDAKGVPGTAEDYVSRIQGYANWYADQPQFKAGGQPVAAAGVPEAAAIPAAYVAAVRDAGRVCATVTPARLAAQIRATSDFDPNRRSATGGEGIAQFTPNLWKEYQPGPKTSVWKPEDAIPALAGAMCDLSHQLAGIGGDDGYRLALGAFQWGADTVRRANGLPRANVAQLADRVEPLAAVYAGDTRLAPAPPTSPPPSTTAPKATTTAAPPVPLSPATGRSSGPANRPSTPELYDRNATYAIRSNWANAVLELPGPDSAREANTRVQLHSDDDGQDQRWRITPAPDAGYVLITNVVNGLTLAVEGNSKDNGAKLVVGHKNPADPGQQWKLEPLTGGGVAVRNRASGKVLDLPGDDFGPPAATGSWNDLWVEQFDFQSWAQDQVWLLDEK